MAGSPRRPIWGWTGPVRGFLAGLAAVLALVLMALAPSKQDEGPVPAVPALVVDPNTARPGVLATLPGLGPTLVGRIVSARAERPFSSVDDLDRRVKGIGPATIANLRPFLRIEIEDDLPAASAGRPSPAGPDGAEPLAR